MFHLYQVEWDPPVLETLPYDVLGPAILRRNIYGPAHMLMDCVLPIRDIRWQDVRSERESRRACPLETTVLVSKPPGDITRPRLPRPYRRSQLVVYGIPIYLWHRYRLVS